MSTRVAAPILASMFHSAALAVISTKYCDSTATGQILSPNYPLVGPISIILTKRLTVKLRGTYTSMVSYSLDRDRAIEKENKKAREVARRKYIDTVRNLVLFVKRRDERMLRFEREMKEKRAEEEVAKMRLKYGLIHE